MSFAARDALTSELTALFTAESRLYRLAGGAGVSSLMVERWQGFEALSSVQPTQIVALSPDAQLALPDFIGEPLTLITTLADGSRYSRTGLVRDAELLSGDGGLARYRLTTVPWLWYLTIGRHNRVFQAKTVIEIVEQVFADYAAIAAWQLADEVGEFLHDTRPRSYCVQYRESDYDFVARLLAEEGLGFHFVTDDEAPAGHRLMLFADAAHRPEDVTSANALGGAGIRFHRAASQEPQDAIQQFGATRQLPYARLSSTSFDYKRKANASAGLPTEARYGAEDAPMLEAYDYAGPYAWASDAEAERYTRLALEAAEARTKTWHGESSVRTLACGHVFTLTESNLDALSAATGDADERKRQFLVLSVSHVGINNLPNDLAKRVEARLGKIPAAHGEQADADLLAQAKQTGYANRFDAIRRDVPWRPVLADDTGLRFNPRPTAPGAQTATVVGPDGATAPVGADALHTDALGRIKVRFHWQRGDQPDDRLTCWIRCTQRDAGAGHGQQFIPRIGQEVLVQFLGGDIDRPVVTGSLYNGQGEAGTPATPGGTQRESDTTAYQQAADHAPSAQGNLAGGQAPAWHGAAAGDNDHRNAAALSGTKTQEFGGSGHNQLVFDDTDGQQRIQLATTQAHSQLNLGHLIHQADNFRGSFRGTGFELRTDAYGAVRGERGVLLSTYGIQANEPAGDFTAGQALLKQANQLGESYSQIATTHTTTALAAHLGAAKANQSSIDESASPLAALLKTAQGQVDAADWQQATADADNKNTALADTKRPHPADPILAIAAKAGLGVVAGQDVHWHADETLTVASGTDSNWAIGERLHIHSGQSIGVLAGVQGSGEGLKLIAGHGDLDLQAQADQMKVQSKDSLKIASANAEGEFAGKKAVKLATAGGASVTLEGGKITVACPGTLTVHAGNKVFTGPGKIKTSMDKFPPGGGLFGETFEFVDPLGRSLADIPYTAEVDNQIQRAHTVEDGRTRRFYTSDKRPARADYTVPKIQIGDDRFE